MNKKGFFLLILLIVFSINTFAYHQGRPLNMINRANNQAQIYFDWMYLNYLERDENGLFLDKESGWIPSLGIRVTKSCGPVLFEGDLGVIKGEGRYDGHLQPTFEPFSSDSDHLFVQGNVKLGYLINIGCYDQLIPYLSYAYSWWNRGGDGITKLEGFGVNSIIERYEFQYALIGVRYQHQFLNCLLVRAGFGIGGTINPKMETNIFFIPEELHELGVANLNSTFYLGGRPIYTGELAVDYRFCEHTHLIGAIDYQQYQFGRSAINILGISEPHSRTYYYQVKVGIAFDFA